jgi:hypothetical protein
MSLLSPKNIPIPYQSNQIRIGHLPVNSGIAAAGRFIRGRWPILLLISIILIVPCYWHSHIEAGDLGSHMYNAWLVKLIHQGRAPGLWVENIWQNVLFDRVVSGFGSLFGFRLAERLAVSLAVLLFFWSVFAFIFAVSRAVPWTLLPVLAMVTYGWTFNMGFFNYYLAVSFSFLGLSVVWRETGWKRLLAILLTPLMLLAHPLGLVWFYCASAYILLSEKLPRRLHSVLLAVTGAILFLVHRFLSSHFRVSSSNRPFYSINGVDQLVVYGNRNRFLAAAVFLFMIGCFVFDAVQRRNEEGYLSRVSLPLQLYFATELGVLLLPSLIHIPRYAAPVSFLVERLSLVSAVLVLALLGTLRQRAWHAFGLGVFACIFFSFLYQDTARINSMEADVEKMVSILPAGTRVMATILRPPGTPVYLTEHIVDRACIERCFSYTNYEPSSGQFRVRALPGNGIVVANTKEREQIENGTYVVRAQDLPAIQIYQCSSSGTDLCTRKLEEGETNDRFGIHPGRH